MIIYRYLHTLNLKLKASLSTFWAKLTLPLKGDFRIGKGFHVRGKIYVENFGKIKMGDRVRINSADWTNPIGYGVRCYLKTFHEGSITIGNNVGMSNCALVSAKTGIVIEDNVLLGGGVRVFDTDFHPIEPECRYGPNKDDSRTKSKPVVIEEGAFIGAGACILKGSRIGKNAVIGAGSVVSGTVGEREIWAGNPARKIRDI